MTLKKVKAYNGSIQYAHIVYKDGKTWIERTVYEDENGVFYVKINDYLFKISDLLDFGDKVTYFTKD